MSPRSFQWLCIMSKSTVTTSEAKVQSISSFLLSKPTQKPSAIKGHLEPIVQHAVHLPKPQLSFENKPDNLDSPCYPILPHKYNAQVPLKYVYSDEDIQVDDSLAYVACLPFRHWVTYILSELITPTTARLRISNIRRKCLFLVSRIYPHFFEDTQATWVATIDTLQWMLSKLRRS